MDGELRDSSDLLKFSWTEIAQRGVPPLSVVPDFDIFKHTLPCDGATRKACIGAFALQRSEKTLVHRVIVTVSASTHTTLDAVGRQHALVFRTGILAPAVRMMK